MERRLELTSGLNVKWGCLTRWSEKSLSALKICPFIPLKFYRGYVVLAETCRAKRRDSIWTRVGNSNRLEIQFWPFKNSKKKKNDNFSP